ncbi:MAG: tail assembly protein, partial [Marivivens sp.]|nr:tail assembly protein [Marivivens sp.]
DYDDLTLPLGKNDLILTPVIAGSGGGAGKIIAGVALVAAAVFIPGAQVLGFAGVNAALAGTTGAIVAGVGTAVGAIGAGLVLGGVAEMISPQPKLPSFDNFDGAQRFSAGAGAVERFGGQALGGNPEIRGVTGGQSYAYNGPANVAGVGTIIPVAYGTVIIGSALLSARIEVTNEGSDPDNNDPLNKSVRTPGPDTITVGGEKLTTAFTDISGGKVQKSEITINDSNQEPTKKYFNTHIPLIRNTFVDFRLPSQASNQYDKLDIIFRLQRGLYDRVGGANTTKTFGYIDYQIEVYPDTVDTAHRTHMSKTRIYGLLDATDPSAIEEVRETQKFRWRHRVRYSDIEFVDGQPNDGDDDVTVRIKIIDFEAFLGNDGSPQPTLKVHAVGHNM